MLAKSWREHGDRDAAHRLVTSHLRLVAKIAMGYRGYGLPISEVISEGNVGLMQAVKRFEPDKGFRLATYAMWWIKAATQEYILRSRSLVKTGTTANQKKLFFNLRKAKSALEEGDLRPDQVKLIAKRLGVTEQDVVDMNRRLGGDVLTAYALAIVGGGPILTLWLARFEKRKVLIGLMALFIAGNLIGAFTTSYSVLLISRVIAGLTHWRGRGDRSLRSRAGAGSLSAFRDHNLIASLAITALGWAGFITLYGYNRACRRTHRGI
jgi:RNA polymerase sigma factor (sigma-70 family)